jgi:hypothetical protein
MTSMGSRQCCECDQAYIYDREDSEAPGDESENGDGWMCASCAEKRRNKPITRIRKHGVRVDRLSPAKRAIFAAMTRRS